MAGAIMTAVPARVLFDAPGPRGRARIRLLTVLGVLLIAALVALAVYQFAASGQLGRSRWIWILNAGYLRFIGQGLLGTLVVTVVAAAVSFPLGIVLALGRLSTNRVVRRLATGYIELFRSIPLLLLIYAFLLALPQFGLNLPVFWKLVVPIILVSTAVLAEVYRAGINAVDPGQTEAALAVGMPQGMAMRSVVLPQAVRLVVPTLVTQLVALLKDSTLGYVVSYLELMKTGQNITAYLHLLIQPYLVVAAIYVLVNFLLSRLAVRLERRLGTRARRTTAAVDDPGLRPAAMA
jgi:glutamate transport system permease protein